MAFEKGKSGNPSGRKVGVPNRANTEFKDALIALLKDCSPDIKGWIYQVAAEDPAKALDQLGKLAEFVTPKQSRTVVAGDDESPLTHNVNVKFVE